MTRIAGRDRSTEKIVTENSGVMPVREIDLQRVMAHGLSGAGAGARLEHRQLGGLEVRGWGGEALVFLLIFFCR